jgi:transcriptional regulator with XRE-family HTH domain
MKISVKNGKPNSKAKLTMKQIYEIKALKNLKQLDIAKKYNVVQSTISKIINNRQWDF